VLGILVALGLPHERAAEGSAATAGVDRAEVMPVRRSGEQV
jgi:hypothetical protein